MTARNFVIKTTPTPYNNINTNLLKDREAFKKRAITQTAVEKKLTKTVDSVQSGAPLKEPFKKPLIVQKPAEPKLDDNSYKYMTGSSQYRFGVLAKIVKHMRNKYQEGDDHALTIEEILDETNQLDIVHTVKNWLVTEALINNPKLEVVKTPQGPRFVFKPVYKIRDGKSLIRLLKQHDLRGLGGILLEDIQESLPHCEKVLKNRSNDILFITRPIDKKKILFYNDKSINCTLDEEFQKLWRSATVDALDDAKIEEYLEKQGICSMRDENPKKTVYKRAKPIDRKKRLSKKPKDNEHLADVLEVYDYNTLTQKGVNPDNYK